MSRCTKAGIVGRVLRYTEEQRIADRKEEGGKDGDMDGVTAKWKVWRAKL